MQFKTNNNSIKKWQLFLLFLWVALIIATGLYENTKIIHKIKVQQSSAALEATIGILNNKIDSLKAF
ncbi:MAG: hypothetical protein P9X27_01085 [Candidatus Kaelpia aquatica]|nr:hypothetical protein [Candidatus Kaelpia aquatica]